MGISTSILVDHGVLEVTYSPDPVSGDDLAEQRKRLADAVSEHNIDKVLLDASTLDRFPSPFTVLEHNEGVVANETLKRATYAVVCASLGENERCLETTGVNRGLNIRCFISREKALAWLKK